MLMGRAQKCSAVLHGMWVKITGPRLTGPEPGFECFTVASSGQIVALEPLFHLWTE